jgi:chitinase
VRASAPRIVGHVSSCGICARNDHVPMLPAVQLTHINYAFANRQGGGVVLDDHHADVDRWYPGDCWNPGCRRGSLQR